LARGPYGHSAQRLSWPVSVSCPRTQAIASGDNGSRTGRRLHAVRLRRSTLTRVSLEVRDGELPLANARARAAAARRPCANDRRLRGRRRRLDSSVEAGRRAVCAPPPRHRHGCFRSFYALFPPTMTVAGTSRSGLKMRGISRGENEQRGSRGARARGDARSTARRYPGSSPAAQPAARSHWRRAMVDPGRPCCCFDEPLSKLERACGWRRGGE